MEGSGQRRSTHRRRGPGSSGPRADRSGRAARPVRTLAGPAHQPGFRRSGPASQLGDAPRAPSRGAHDRKRHRAGDCSFAAGLHVPAIGVRGLERRDRDFSLPRCFALAGARGGARLVRHPADPFPFDGRPDLSLPGRRLAGVCRAASPRGHRCAARRDRFYGERGRDAKTVHAGAAAATKKSAGNQARGFSHRSRGGPHLPANQAAGKARNAGLEAGCFLARRAIGVEEAGSGPTPSWLVSLAAPGKATRAGCALDWERGGRAPRRGRPSRFWPAASLRAGTHLLRSGWGARQDHRRSAGEGSPSQRNRALHKALRQAPRGTARCPSRSTAGPQARHTTDWPRKKRTSETLGAARQAVRFHSTPAAAWGPEGCVVPPGAEAPRSPKRGRRWRARRCGPAARAAGRTRAWRSWQGTFLTSSWWPTSSSGSSARPPPWSQSSCGAHCGTFLESPAGWLSAKAGPAQRQ
jgi:hypothetical protein